MQMNDQHALFEALADPASYPHAVSEIRRFDTHISTVFLTGPYAYKIKKPVDLGFVDFTSLEKRRFYCEQELQLNRRLTSDVYQAVVAFSMAGNTIRMGGPGEPVEFAVRMRQLSSSRTMKTLLKDEALTLADLERLAVMLADFHQAARRVTDQPVWQHVKAACDENFRHIQPYRGDFISGRCLDEIQDNTGRRLDNDQALFERRRNAGWVRDGHGDLRAEHVYFTNDGPIEILDCVEFNPRLRIVDVASDLAFLAMDMDYLSKPQLVAPFLDTYCRVIGDAGLLGPMEFYKCYRAMVRCKVSCIQRTAPGLRRGVRNAYCRSACRYLELAHTYARRMMVPTLWVFCGLPASGKSTLASGLAEALGVECLNSDRVRKARFGLAPLDCASDPLDGGVYSAEANQMVYDQLIDAACRAIEAGRSFILDATFSSVNHRQRALRIAKDGPAAVFFIECVAHEEALRRRLGQRAQGGTVSDARLSHLEPMQLRFEPLSDIPPASHIRINTSAAVKHCLHDLITERYLHRIQDGLK